VEVLVQESRRTNGLVQMRDSNGGDEADEFAVDRIRAVVQEPTNRGVVVGTIDEEHTVHSSGGAAGNALSRRVKCHELEE